MKLVIDVETLQGIFTITAIDYSSDECWQYVIHKDKNELDSIKDLLSKTSFMIGFNSIHFDSVILAWMMKQKTVTAEEIYKVAQITINQKENRNAFKPYQTYKYNTTWHNIDLFLYWSKMLRLSKKLSLKYFAVNLDMKIQEMPIHHSKTDFTEEEIIEVLDYNKNDVLVTKALCNKLKEQINLRIGIRNQYKLEALSWDAPKIASELLLDSFCNKKHHEGMIPMWEFKKQIRNDRRDKISFRNGDYIPKIEFKTKVFQDLYQDVCNARDGFKRNLIYKRFDNTFIKISYGSGGIHSVNENEDYHSTDTHTVWTSDVSSLYPSLLENYKFIRKDLTEVLDIYSEKKQERIKAKKEGNKVVNETLKLVLNSTTGLMDNPYSWLYSPAEIMALRITGQLILTRLTEECNLNNFLVISLNTDGIEVIIDKGREDEYLNLIKIIEKEFNLEFEHDQYKSIHYKSVNDYLALTVKDKTKVKGEFIYEKVLDGSNEFLIIAIAVKEYLLNRIPVEDTIMNHINIYDFCCSKKISKDYKIFYNNVQQQQLNRFYCSKKGAYLYKLKPTKKIPTMEHIFGDSGVVILNDISTQTPQELEVDFNYYINSARNRIKLFEREQLSLF